MCHLAHRSVSICRPNSSGQMKATSSRVEHCLLQILEHKYQDLLDWPCQLQLLYNSLTLVGSGFIHISELNSTALPAMRRTDTTKRQTFTLPFPAAATFDFNTLPSHTPLRAIYVTIPPQSTWRMPYHRHPSEVLNSNTTPACHSVTSLSGPLLIVWAAGIRSANLSGHTGVSHIFEPGLWVGWSRPSDRSSTLLKVAFIAEHRLWRNICSATLDRDIYPQLSTTPFWVKGMFALLSFLPSWKSGMLDAMLWIQLQSIFHAHDFHLYHGHIPFIIWAMFPWIWPNRPAPWVQRLQLRSLCIISRLVMTSSYWVGRLLLGMRGEYAEYSPKIESAPQKDDSWDYFATVYGKYRSQRYKVWNCNSNEV